MVKIQSKQEEVLNFAKKREHWRNNPIDFFKEVLGMKLPYHQKKMIEACYKRNRIAIKSANAVGKCVNYNEYCILADGSIVLSQDLIGKEFDILSYDPDTGKQCSKTARAIDNGIQECYKITTNNGKTVNRTFNHPLYKGNLINNTEINIEGWVEVQNLKIGDYILCPTIHENIAPTKLDFSNTEAETLGYILGCRGLCYNILPYEVLNLAKEWNLYNCNPSKKVFPSFVGRLPLKQIAIILNKLYMYSNYNVDENAITITLESERLIKEIRLLLMRFGIISNTNTNYTKYNNIAWDLSISDPESIIKFYEDIVSVNKEAMSNINYLYSKIKSSKSNNIIKYSDCPDGFTWEKIVNVERIGTNPTVCIEVDDTHTFLTEVYDHNSHCVAALAFHFFFTRVTNDPNDTTIVLITAPTFAQIKDSIFANIKTFSDIADNYIKNKFGEEYSFLPKDFSESANVCEYRFNAKCFITGIATGEGSGGAGNRFSSRHATHVLVIADESQGVSEGTFSAIEGILSGGEETKYILLGNTTLPNGAGGTYYEAFQENSTFYQLSITAFDSPNFIEPNITLEDMLAPEYEPNNWRKKLDKYCGTNYEKARLNDEVDLWENEVKKKLPLSVITNPISVYRILEGCGFNPKQYNFLTRVMAEFPSGGGSCVIDAKLLDESFNNYDNPECFEDDGIVAMGVDISAGLGRDFSTICIRRGNKVVYLEEFQEKAPVFEKIILDKYKEYGCSYCNLERDGMGAIVYEHLEEHDDIVINQIVSGGGPGIPNPINSEEHDLNEQLKMQFHRQRDYLWFHLNDLLSPYWHNKHGGKPILLPKNNKLKKQLLSATWKKNTTNKTQVESKEDIRKKLGTSTDLADAVIFAFADVGEAGLYASCDCEFVSVKNLSWF